MNRAANTWASLQAGARQYSGKANPAGNTWANRRAQPRTGMATHTSDHTPCSGGTDKAPPSMKIRCSTRSSSQTGSRCNEFGLAGNTWANRHEQPRTGMATHTSDHTPCSGGTDKAPPSMKIRCSTRSSSQTGSRCKWYEGTAWSESTHQWKAAPSPKGRAHAGAG